MNWELVKSVIAKALPIALAFVVGKGWLTQEQSNQVPELVAQVALAATALWTFVRSFKTHGK